VTAAQGRLNIESARLDDPALEPLRVGLAEEYERLYGPNDEMSAYDAADFDPPTGTFLVVSLDGRVVAGGGLRRWSDDIGEIKRMWVAPDRRRQGLGLVVLNALEDAGRRLGYRRLRLETGEPQRAAIALYEAAGYTRIRGYGRYAGMPLEVSFERRLDENVRGDSGIGHWGIQEAQHGVENHRGTGESEEVGRAGEDRQP
jgi:GNAT superfamily N-acetyltransferase